MPTSTPAPPEPGLSRAGLATVLAGAALAPLDQFVVAVALPSIRADLGASPAALEWVVAAYGLGFALLLVVGGRLGDAFGRRRLFVAGLAGFTATSLACGLAPSTGVLVAARALQGVAAAMLAPQALSILQATTSGPHRTRVLGLYGATGGLAMIAGQLAGGLLVSADLGGSTWRPVFVVTVPLGAAAALAARRTVPESRAARPGGVDPVGVLLLAVALLALLVPLTLGGEPTWPGWARALPVAAPLAAALLWRAEARREARGAAALLPPSLLRLPPLRAGVVVAVPFFAAHGGFLYVTSLVLQDVERLGPLAAGVALAPLGVGFLTTASGAGRFARHPGHRVIVAGGAAMAIGLAIAAAAPDAGLAVLAPGTLLVGAGLGAVSPALFRVVLSAVPAEAAGVGSGVLTTTQQVSVAVGAAAAGSAFTAAGTTVALAGLAALALAVAALSLRLPKAPG